MADTKNYSNQEANNNEKASSSSQLTMSLAGGVIGAAIGYLVTSGNSKMLTESIDMEKLGSKSSELSEAVMEKSRSLFQTVVGTATKMFERQGGNSKESSSGLGDGNLEGLVGRVEEMLSQLSSTETGQMLGEKKEQLQDRMGNIVEMLSKMVDEKNNQNSNSSSGNGGSGVMGTPQEQSQLNSGGSGEEDKKKNPLGETQGGAYQGTSNGYQPGQSGQNLYRSTENQKTSQSNTGDKGYSMVNVDEDTHHLLEGLEKDS